MFLFYVANHAEESDRFNETSMYAEKIPPQLPPSPPDENQTEIHCKDSGDTSSNVEVLSPHHLVEPPPQDTQIAQNSKSGDSVDNLTLIVKTIYVELWDMITMKR
jgi:hypothetical protein